jgi:hypothetical protein
MEESKLIVATCPFLGLFHMEDSRQLHCLKELLGPTLITLSMGKDHQPVVMVRVCLLDVIMLQGKACCIHLQILITEIASYLVYIQAFPWLTNVELIELAIVGNWS